MIQEGNQRHDFSLGDYIGQVCEILVSKELLGVSQCGI